MRIAVIGAGVAGLTAARRLARLGHAPTVYERWPGLGGQAATLDVGGGHRVERYYHHLFTSDRDIVELYAELGLPDEVEWRESSVAVFAAGDSHPFTSPLDLLRFRPLSPLARVRMGAAALWLQRGRRPVEHFEGETARAWIVRVMGEAAWSTVWGPLLRGKFGARAEEISMAWLWGKLTLRRQIRGREARQELLGYPRHSFEPLFAALAREIEAGGGRVLIDHPAARIDRDGGGLLVSGGAAESFRRGHHPGDFERREEPERYDVVLATVPTDTFAALLDPSLHDALAPGFRDRLGAIEYHTALCLLLELDRPFTRFYWTNVADRRVPFVGLIEHTNLVEPERYDGRRFLYVANYVDAADPLLELDADELLRAYEPGLRLVNPRFSPDWVRARWRFVEPAAQPVVTVGYRDRIPPLQTGVAGLLLANTTQIYPEDRGTNYSVRLGERAAQEALRGSQAPEPAAIR